MSARIRPMLKCSRCGHKFHSDPLMPITGYIAICPKCGYWSASTAITATFI